MHSIPMSQMVRKISGLLNQFKSIKHRDNAIIVAIEGLSNTGKSTLALALEKELDECILIEGDLFHYGRNKTKNIYHELINQVKSGKDIPDNFPALIWDYDKMQKDLFDAVTEFDHSKKNESQLILKNVLDEKKDGTEHDKSFTLNRKSIILVPCMYIRHMPGIDYSIFLDASVDTIIQRKVERTLKLGGSRSSTETGDMVMLLEEPVMQKWKQKYPLITGINVNVNDFGHVYFIDPS